MGSQLYKDYWSSDRDNNFHKEKGWKEMCNEGARDDYAPLLHEYQQYKLINPLPHKDLVVDEFCKQVALLKDMNESEDVITNLSLNLGILEKVEIEIALVSEHKFLPEQNPGILLHQFCQIKGETQLRLGMFDEAKESLETALCLIEDQLQFQQDHSDKVTVTISMVRTTYNLSECFICQGQPDDAILVLQKYLPDDEVMRILKGNKVDIAYLHFNLMDCYTVKGELATAIQHYEMGIQVLDGNPLQRDREPKRWAKDNQELHEWRGSKKQKEVSWREFIVERHRDEYAPLRHRYQKHYDE